MTNSELASRLCELGCQLEEAYKDPNSALMVIEKIAAELHKLSNERYEPSHSHTSWADLKEQVASRKQAKNFPF